MSQQKGRTEKKTTHSGLIITYIVQYDKLCSNIHHFHCQRRPSRRGLVPELGPNPAVPTRRRNPKAQIGLKRQAHTPEMTAVNFHRPPTRTADAAQHKRHESEEDYLHKTSPEGPHGQPNPHLHWTRTRQPSFFSKMPDTKNTPGLVNIDKNTPGRPKGRTKKNLEMCDHMAQRVSKTPPKTTRHQKGTLLGQENKQPF